MKEPVANDTICNAVKNLSNCLYRYYEKKVLILLDEYDTPMQEHISMNIGKNSLLL